MNIQNQSQLDRLFLAMIRYDAGDPKRIQHFTKVHSYAELIGRSEGLDDRTQFILEAAAYVHDIGIHAAEKKYGSCSGKLQEQEGPAEAEKLLEELDFPADVTERVSWLVGHHHTYSSMDSPDYQILVEADFLVNLYEDQSSMEAVRAARNKIFRTETGLRILTDMFGTEDETGGRNGSAQ